MSHRYARIRIPVALVSAVGLFFGALVAPAIAGDANTPTYVAVVDAGSSGSRIALYTNGTQTLGSPNRLVEVKPKVAALSSFESTPANAGPEGIGPLLDELDIYLSANGIEKSSVSVSILATAGLRNVEQRDPAASAAIVSSAAEYIPTRGYQVGEVGIMSGQREALYAWVDANATDGTLADGDNKIGIVEIGGASAQVAFQSPLANGRGVETAVIGGLTFNVVALSYLGLGQNDARAVMRTLPGNGKQCFPNNSTEKAPSVFEATSPKPLAAAKANFKEPACNDAYDLVIKRVGASPLNLANNDRIRPTGIRKLPGFEQSRFQGVSSIAFNMRDLQVKSGRAIGTRFERAITQTCSGKNAWAKVASLYKDPAELSFAEVLCANSQYTHAFTLGSAGVGVSQKKLSVDPTFAKVEPSWSKGFALTQLNP